MGRIAETFQSLWQAHRKALMPFVTMGHPHKDSALGLVPALVEGGADLVELGAPFSDPLAEGPTIQASSQQALDNGMNLALCLSQAATLRARGVEVPFLLMGYYNPIFQMGVENFARRAADAGIDGAIIPDLPPEESDDLQRALSTHEIDLIYLLAPTSDDDRVRCVVERASGFVYLVSLTGVTGARDHLPSDLGDFVTRVRALTDLPLAVGFGISTPEQAARVAGVADGVIVGSALVQTIGADGNPIAAARRFVAALRAGIDEN